jgi:formylglycine-generating enzyme required for sulfatase activity
MTKQMYRILFGTTLFVLLIAVAQCPFSKDKCASPVIYKICSDGSSCDSCVFNGIKIQGTCLDGNPAVHMENNGDVYELNIDATLSDAENIVALLPENECLPEGMYQITVISQGITSAQSPFALDLCDTDCDGKDDGRDNCPDIANPDQFDTDGDKIGNLCDACPKDVLNDIDNDEICGSVDNCPEVSNADQKDLDQDKLGDVCDKDADGDGYEGLLGDKKDCNDVDKNINPIAKEICDDTIDNDCDGLTDVNDTICRVPGMAYVAAGWFWRGSCNEGTNPSCKLGEPGYGSFSSYETPLRAIYLNGYYIDTYEVTVSEFDACVKADKCSTQNYRTKSSDSVCNYGYTDRGNLPMNCANWYVAVEYCSYVGKRLPTEAEWEKAARGINGLKYPWGNSDPTCEYANFSPNGYFCVGQPTRVGSYPKGVSPYGAYDMAGNVLEWVHDCYFQNYYSTSPDTNPTGPCIYIDDWHVFRGGSWGDSFDMSRTARRNYQLPHDLSGSLGFRCAKSE